jgi:hypothetical protein
MESGTHRARYHPSSYFGRGAMTTWPESTLRGMPIRRQHGEQSTQGLSPSLMSPLMAQTAGTLEHARHMSIMTGWTASVRG